MRKSDKSAKLNKVMLVDFSISNIGLTGKVDGKAWLLDDSISPKATVKLDRVLLSENTTKKINDLIDSIEDDVITFIFGGDAEGTSAFSEDRRDATFDEGVHEHFEREIPLDIETQF